MSTQRRLVHDRETDLLAGPGVKCAVASLCSFVAPLLFCPVAALAGPPFVTDDPEPVEYRHWEFYVASQNTKTAGGWSGTAPHFEVNYGVLSNVQLHLIAPVAYDAPAQGSQHYGYGDSEIGVKYRFIQGTDRLPQVGIFPLLEVPTGNSDEDLGRGHVQAFLPVWLQKGFGPWTLYGGGGYSINPGEGNHDWTFFGAVAQCQVTENVLVGGELYHRTATEVDGRGDAAFNLGTLIDFTHHHHLLVSAGCSIDGPTQFQVYIAYQVTLGPHFFSEQRDPSL